MLILHEINDISKEVIVSNLIIMAKKKKKLSVQDVLKQIPEKELRSFVNKQLGIQEVRKWHDWMVKAGSR